jgi:hypothetical protein
MTTWICKVPVGKLGTRNRITQVQVHDTSSVIRIKGFSPKYYQRRDDAVRHHHSRLDSFHFRQLSSAVGCRHVVTTRDRESLTISNQHLFKCWSHNHFAELKNIRIHWRFMPRLRGRSIAAVVVVVVVLLLFYIVVVPKPCYCCCCCCCLSMTMLLIKSHQERAPLSQLRKAAGSKSLETLKDAVRGWTREELNIAGQEGKTPLHMAAWKGCLENVQFLLEEMECDIDIYSKGEFSYGKTAIFFAATQSRVDVMEYLLSRNPKVTIVNNKGQSVLSIAFSHDILPSILQRIMQLEQQERQADNDTDGDVWWNFRATHSDGLEYGDLDLRFLDRPLRGEDVVIAWAVNPTTKQTRKGGFARRNPALAQERQRKQQQPKKKPDARILKNVDQQSAMTPQQEQEWEPLWKDLSICLTGEASQLSNLTIEYMLRIVALGNQRRHAWIQDSADKLLHLVKSDVAAVVMLLRKSQEMSSDERTRELLEKMYTRIIKKDKVREEDQSNVNKSQTRPYKRDNPFGIGTWEKALIQVQHLSIRELEHNRRVSSTKLNILTLPHPPRFVHTIDSLQELKSRFFSLYSRADFERPVLVSIDTEWYDEEIDNSGDTRIVLSTIQIAFCGTGRTSIQTYVVDLRIQQSDYHHAAQELVHWILYTKNLLVLGFAMLHDVRMLESFVKGNLEDTVDIKSTFLDIQLLLASKGKEALPGLKKCASKFSNLPLSKTEQCSKWGNRPLGSSQLEYAGLDAAILLVLLSEEGRRQQELRRQAFVCDSPN